MLVGSVLAIALAGCGQAAETEGNVRTQTPVQTETSDHWEGEMDKVQIDIQGYGTVILELNSDAAPETVANFLMLAKNGFYDGLTFHRIIDGFMIQGGDPQGTGSGGSGTNIKGEFASNGFNNPLSHVRGAVSMARSQQPNSASSQFFIVHQDSLFLDGEYAAFGRVIEGMDVVDKIASSVEVLDDNGTVAEGAKPIITKVTVLD